MRQACERQKGVQLERFTNNLYQDRTPPLHTHSILLVLSALLELRVIATNGETNLGFVICVSGYLQMILRLTQQDKNSYRASDCSFKLALMLHQKERKHS